ncbi:MAG TPA: ATP-dependent sacrificial sulfur transferase LarE [Victivallales bacterium]|nr:ATP-dependent sacrificial sulfur transferase LarE [Victivallales bacterium]
MKKFEEKQKKLAEKLSALPRLAIAFSGGYDSSFLAKFAEKILGPKKILLIHVDSPFCPSRDKKAVAKFAELNKIPILLLRANPLLDSKISSNTPKRCYHCKTKIMRLVISEGRKMGFANFADGTNLDDISEHRPGFRATEELRILHPLLEAQIRKNDMIQIAKKLKFDLSFSPSSSCLATRIPTGTRIDAKSLKKADMAENILCDFSIPSPRVRIIGKNASIEVEPEYFDVILRNRKRILNKFEDIGFSKIFLDIRGYRKKAETH